MEIQSQRHPSTQVTVVQGNSSGVVKSTTPPTEAVEPAAQAGAGQVDRIALEQALSDMSELINVTNPPQLTFSIDDTTEKPVVRVTDASTGELIRQFPSEEILAIARSLDKMKGLLLNQEA